MLEQLKQQVCAANLKLVAEGLVIQTWGNVSGIDRTRGLMVIKPSGVPYVGMKPEHMVVVSLADGKVIEGNLKPSSDTPTHLILYRAFKEIGGVVHTHSLYATAWAQACSMIPSFGTTQADYWHGDVPCTRKLKPKEIENDYEAFGDQFQVRRANLLLQFFEHENCRDYFRARVRMSISCFITPCKLPFHSRVPKASCNCL